MPRESTESHLATLRHRYDERRLREAATRRAHLDYQRIPIGGAAGSGRVKFLLAQMHQTYYFGFSESACILAGTVLEQGLVCRLGDCLTTRGPLSVTRSGARRWLQNRDDLLELELVDMMDLARAEGILRDGRTMLLAHHIRWIRNMVVHERIPLFRARDEEHLELVVTKSRRGRPRTTRISLDRSEVRELEALSDAAGEERGSRGLAAQLTAYYCVSRTRMVLRSLFTQPHTETRKDDESSGSLFPWAQS